MTKVLRSSVLFIATFLMPHCAQADCVVLLHGLARTSSSMNELEVALEDHGYHVANIDYPSREKTIEELSEIAITGGIKECNCRKTEDIHFVTHSLGGIIIRYYLAHHEIKNLGRVVMLAPPNKGSEVVDKLGHLPGFEIINGPAGTQLGTNYESIPLSLGPVTYSVGIIAGTSTINPALSIFLPNPDDGKVSVENTKVEGMTDFITVPASHPFIMKNKEAIKQTIAFLDTGSFLH